MSSWTCVKNVWKQLAMMYNTTPPPEVEKRIKMDKMTSDELTCPKCTKVITKDNFLDTYNTCARKKCAVKKQATINLLFDRWQVEYGEELAPVESGEMAVRPEEPLLPSFKSDEIMTAEEEAYWDYMAACRSGYMQ